MFIIHRRLQIHLKRKFKKIEIKLTKWIAGRRLVFFQALVSTRIRCQIARRILQRVLVLIRFDYFYHTIVPQTAMSLKISYKNFCLHFEFKILPKSPVANLKPDHSGRIWRDFAPSIRPAGPHRPRHQHHQRREPVSCNGFWHERGPSPYLDCCFKIKFEENEVISRSYSLDQMSYKGCFSLQVSYSCTHLMKFCRIVVDL